MEELQTYKTPKNILVKMQVVHFGKILFNLQFLAFAIILASVLTFIFPAIYYLMLICIAVFSLFTLFANPTFMSYWSGGDKLLQVADIFTHSWKYTIPIILALAITSIICLSFDRKQKHTTRIIVSVIIAVLASFILILKLINGGGF